MKKRRQATVEPVLGTLINFMGVRRIWCRGLQSANKFMLGAAIAYNLKKWLNFKAPKTKTATMALKNVAKGLYLYFFSLRQLLHHHNSCYKTKISLN